MVNCRKMNPLCFPHPEYDTCFLQSTTLNTDSKLYLYSYFIPFYCLRNKFRQVYLSWYWKQSTNCSNIMCSIYQVKTNIENTLVMLCRRIMLSVHFRDQTEYAFHHGKSNQIATFECS